MWFYIYNNCNPVLKSNRNFNQFDEQLIIKITLINNKINKFDEQETIVKNWK